MVAHSHHISQEWNVSNMTTQRWLESLLSSRKLSITKLAVTLGYRSPTSLKRILHNRANIASIQQLMRRLEQCASLQLTPVELRSLMEVVRMEAVGEEQYLGNREMEMLLQGTRANVGHIAVLSLADGSSMDLDALYEYATEIRITLLNTCYAPVQHWLLTLLDVKKASVRHFLAPAADAPSAIHSINALSEIAFFPQYEAYTVKLESMENMDSKGLLYSDAMLCTYRDRDGWDKEDLIVFMGKGQAILRTIAAGETSLAPFFEIDTSLCENMKRSFPECRTFPDYLEFIRQFTALELDRNTYRLKPDICIDIIPTHILKAAGLEGNLPKVDGFNELIDAFETIFITRYNNALTKRRVTHLVMKREAMRRFAQTGVATDQFWGFRPYTIPERIEIFETLLTQQQQNPYFHLNFLKDDHFVRNSEIGYYEGLGMLMLPDHTTYDLINAQYSEVMITQTDFCERFKNYYLHTILRTEVISPQECLDFLREQIIVLNKMLC